VSHATIGGLFRSFLLRNTGITRRNIRDREDREKHRSTNHPKCKPLHHHTPFTFSREKLRAKENEHPASLYNL
jgi:hypothetical protein